MTDRQPSPGKEGRVLITPEDGSPAFYATLEMADDPLEKGTPWAKQSVWPDAVSEKFGLPTASLPSDGFSFLGDFNLHWWRKRLLTVERGALMDLSSASDVPQGFIVSFGSYNDQGDSPKYADSVKVDEATGGVVLDGEIETLVNLNYNDYTAASVLAGKYVQCRDFNPIYVPENAVPMREYESPSRYSVWMSAIYPLSVSRGEAEYLMSKDPDAYPKNVIAGGIQYEYLRIPFENAVGSAKFDWRRYIGNGLFGEDSPTVFEVSFCPDLLIVNESVFVRGVTPSSGDTALEWGDTYIKVVETAQEAQFNYSGRPYSVLILGH